MLVRKSVILLAVMVAVALLTSVPETRAGRRTILALGILGVAWIYAELSKPRGPWDDLDRRVDR